MRYRISQIRIGPKEFADRARLKEALAEALRGKLGRNVPFSDLQIVRESVDARHKPQVTGVYTLDFSSPKELNLPEASPKQYKLLPPPREKPKRRPVIAGFGPCGMFAALILAEAGLDPIVLERGRRVEERVRDVRRFWEEGILDPESNVQFGEGGAGTFSDGKLTTGIRDIRIRRVLNEFVRAGADEAILYQAKPHIGTDRLRIIVPNIRHRISELGGEIRFGHRLEGIDVCDGRLEGVRIVKSGDPETEAGERIVADDLILAIGHSARDTFRMLLETGLSMEQKPFSIGVRIEHPQEMIDAAQYGDASLARCFGPASYQLHHRCENGRGVYTFCMCPGGTVINASSEAGGAVTNGMSLSGRDSGTANSGLLVDVRTADFESDDPLAGVEFQRKYEALARENGRRFEGGLPKTRYLLFQKSEEDPVSRSVPAFAREAILEAMPHLGRKLRGFDSPDAVLTAVETRSSSPVRIIRDARMQSCVEGLIPAGEGPGYAGGIMSAAVDGIRAAEQIIRRYSEQG